MVATCVFKNSVDGTCDRAMPGRRFAGLWANEFPVLVGDHEPRPALTLTESDFDPYRRRVRGALKFAGPARRSGVGFDGYDLAAGHKPLEPRIGGGTRSGVVESVDGGQDLAHGCQEICDRYLRRPVDPAERLVEQM